MRTVVGIALVLFALAPAASTAATFVDDFEGGANLAGWAFIRGGDVMESSGGNPGWWLHQPTFDTFAPIIQCVPDGGTPFTGDYRALEVTRLGFDAQNLHMDYPDGSGRLISIVLRNDHGTPDNVDDDDLAYFLGPNIPIVGQGWVHYDIDIPSQSNDPVPPGWYGAWVGDCSAFRPGVTWSDVITHVDTVEIWWIPLCDYAIFQQWNVGADNMVITYENDNTPVRKSTWGEVKSAYRR